MTQQDSPRKKKSGADKSAAPRKVDATRAAILDATKSVMRDSGYSGLSTRNVALAAGVPLSQIHYHFGSKQGLVLATFEFQNAQLLDRQTEMYADQTLTLSQRWKRACDYLDDDLESGYVRTLMELWAAGWSEPEVAHVVRESIKGWMLLLTTVAREAERKYGRLSPFVAEDLSALIGSAFIGAEAYLLLGFDTKQVPVRRALRRVGEALRRLEE